MRAVWGWTYLLDGGARDAGACVFRMDGDAFLRDEVSTGTVCKMGGSTLIMSTQVGCVAAWDFEAWTAAAALEEALEIAFLTAVGIMGVCRMKWQVVVRGKGKQGGPFVHSEHHVASRGRNGVHGRSSSSGGDGGGPREERGSVESPVGCASACECGPALGHR